MVYNTLNRLKWQDKLKSATIIILHRGLPGDRKAIGGYQLTEVKRSYFSYVEDNRETTIPNHRVLEISSKGRTIWRRHESGKALGG